MGKPWRSIPCGISELRLDITLACGQSFRWKEIQPGTWRSVLSDCIWTLKQSDTHILYQVYDPREDSKSPRCMEGTGNGRQATEQTKVQSRSKKRGSGDELARSKKQRRSELPTLASESPLVPASQDIHEHLQGDHHHDVLHDYFQLDVRLAGLYEQWKGADENFSRVSVSFPGVRILRQDPVENLVSFICSSNNNISRITGMVEKLCQNYGTEIGVLDGVTWHAFPTLAALSGKGVEERLRKLGFGYRAKFINQTAKKITSELGGEEWLWKLRGLPYSEVHSQLLQLQGVGAKVADCVCLMSLDKREAIPVDTHVWQIAARDYMTSLQKTKSLTDRTYREIGDFFRELFGEYAGWAHSVLFSADLKKFQDKSNTPEKNKDNGAKDKKPLKNKRSRKTVKMPEVVAS
ncbi:N-glycosylase/DNA lyase-like [Diadema antillarum]|uniref:N-glycosylase/DNA lyase-like n=1 Tax=Diadema antillarum TaxID=105358 RepID=UPI003A876254